MAKSKRLTYLYNQLMSKNTGTSELINYFDLGVNGDVGIAGSLDINTIANATTDTDTFLVSDTGIIKYRTGAQLLSDIGAQAAGNYVTTDTSQAITANKSFTVGFSLASEGSGNQTSFFRNTSSIFSGSGGSNIFGFNNSNNIYFGKGLNNGGVLQWNNTTATRYYTLPDADGTIALTSNIPANPVGGTGTTNYLPKFTGSTTIGNSQIFDNGTNVGINTNTPLSTNLLGALTIVKSYSSDTPASTTAQTYYTNQSGLYLFGRNSGLTIVGANNEENQIIFANTSTVAFASINTGTGSNSTGGDMYFKVGSNTEAMRIFATTRNVHIGPTPVSDNGARLQVSGTATISGSVTATNVILSATGYLGFSGGTNYIEGDNNNNIVRIGTNNVPRLIINGSGNVGIGTSSPAANLQVASSSSPVIAMNLTGSATSGPRGDLAWYNSSISTVALIRATAVTDNVGTQLEFYTRPAAGSLTQVMTLASTGAATFSSNVTVENSVYVRNGNGVYVNNTANTRTGYFITSAAGTELSSHNGAGEPLILIAPDTTATIRFYTGGSTSASERMRITSSGNVLIGTTTDNGGKLQLGGFSGAVNQNNGIKLTNNVGTIVGLEIGGSNDSYIGTISASNFSIRTGNTARMHITSAGIVDIAGPLVVRGTLPADQTDAAVIDHFSNTMRIFSYGAAGVTGDFQFRTAAGGAGSNLVSTINGTTGAYTAVSDINKKKDFEESTIGLNAILGLKPTLYRMKSENNTQKHLGFIAQEVRQYIPNAYVENGEFIGLNEMPIIAALTKAIQEQQQQIQELKNKLL